MSKIEDWLDCYDPEGRVFPRLPTKSKLSARDVLLILKWKLGRIKDSNCKTVAKASLKAINEAIQLAENDRTKIKAVKMLTKISRIKLATASAILTVCHPDKFSIIDWRVLESMRLRPSRAEEWSAKDYVQKFLPKLAKYRDKCGKSLRDTDRAPLGQIGQ